MVGTSSGETAVAVTLAFNSLGWKPQNFLFNLIDTLLGDPLIAVALDGEEPSAVSASISNSTIAAGGDVRVSADGAAGLNATVSNAADSTAAALFNATGESVGIVIAQNKVASSATASVSDVGATVAGELAVTASDEAGVYSNIKLVSSSSTQSNNGGTAVLQDEQTEATAPGITSGSDIPAASSSLVDVGVRHRHAGLGHEVDDVEGALDASTARIVAQSMPRCGNTLCMTPSASPSPGSVHGPRR